MVILGIHGGYTINQHDASACIVSCGKIIAAAEEERYTRDKGSYGKLPINSIKAILNQISFRIEDIDLVVISGCTYPGQLERTKLWINHYFGFSPEILVINHQIAHIYSTYPLDPSLGSSLLSSDAYGDKLCALISKFNGIEEAPIIEELDYSFSLGRIYGLITNFLGYRAGEDEYKVMGLSAFGNPSRFDLSELDINKNSKLFQNNESYYSSYKVTPYEPFYSNEIFKIFKVKRRLPGEKLKKDHIDIAASVQQYYEDQYKKLLNFTISKTNSKEFFVAGGTALNSLANYKMRKLKVVNNIKIQPAASDRGLSLGCAVYGSIILDQKIPYLSTLELGSSYSLEFKTELLNKLGIKYIIIDNLYLTLAKMVSEGKVIAVHRGRSEFGPRALGNRSIIASPAVKDMKQILNKKIKFREAYRPFACMCREDDLDSYFIDAYQAPYMTEIFEASDLTKKDFPSIVHVDGTCRIQTITRESSQLYYDVLSQLLTIGHPPLLINTSFNLSGEPIVETPQDAIRSFYSSGIEALFLDNILLEK